MGKPTGGSHPSNLCQNQKIIRIAICFTNAMQCCNTFCWLCLPNYQGRIALLPVEDGSNLWSSAFNGFTGVPVTPLVHYSVQCQTFRYICILVVQQIFVVVPLFETDHLIISSQFEWRCQDFESSGYSNPSLELCLTKHNIT